MDTVGKRKPCPTKGYFYELWLNDECIARSQTNVETDAARVLLSRGIKAFRIWRRGRASHDYMVDCEKVAGWQLSEEDRDGFRARRYRNPEDRPVASETTQKQQRQPSALSAPRCRVFAGSCFSLLPGKIALASKSLPRLAREAATAALGHARSDGPWLQPLLDARS